MEGRYTLRNCYPTDWYDQLKFIEELLQSCEQGVDQEYFTNAVGEALSHSALDIGIRFDAEQGVFYPSGAKLLDERLVNEELRWLSENQYTKVYEPFEKGLRFLLEARNDSSKLQDVVTDLHEALEAFARIVCENNKDLSANAAKFISNLNLNDHYKSMLKSYIAYANKFRHAEGDKQQIGRAHV